eukprot:jgi/Psemu1/12938/gm1.12938_g
MFTSKHGDSFYCSLRLPRLVGYKTKDTVLPRDTFSEQTQDKGNKSDEGNNKDGKLENEGDLKSAAKVTMSKEPAKMVGAKSLVIKDIELAPKDQRHFPLKDGQGLTSHDILEVMLKDPDPEILYPIYKIIQAVMYVGDKSRI